MGTRNQHTFAKGHRKAGPGRPKGSKNKTPPAEIKRDAIQEFRGDYMRLMRRLARSKIKSDQHLFVSEYRRLLPRDEAIMLTGDKQLVLVVPPAPAECPKAGQT